MIVCSGRLPGASTAGEALVEREAEAAVVQADAGAGRDDAAAERLVERVDQRAAVALGVDRAQVGRVALAAAGARSAAPRVAGEQLATGRRRIRVADVLVQRRERVPGLDLEVDALGAERVERAEVLALERAQDHQRRDPGRRRRQLVDLQAAVGGVDRLDPARAVRGHVLGLEEAARRARGGDDPLGDLALVERPRALARRSCRACARGRAGARARPRAARGRRAGTPPRPPRRAAASPPPRATCAR